MDWFLVEGINPEPWQASEAATGRAKGGKTFVRFHKPQGLTDYQEALKSEFRRRYPDIEPATGTAEVYFYFWREVNADSKAKVADATNLMKAAEDALQGILYVNDKQNKNVHSFIVEQLADTEPMLLIGIRPFQPPPAEIFDVIDKLRESAPKPESNFRHIDVPF
jgi:Holliday junction resolvase RusA-like endonuclease